LEESKEEAEHGVDRIVGSNVMVTSWLVKEKEIGIPDPREDAQRDEDVVLKRKEDMLREEKGMLKILKELTEKDRTSPRSSQEQAVEIEELESQLLGNFIERMATPPGIPAVFSLASTKHACSCYSTTITASRGYHKRRGCDGGTTILISIDSSSSVGCSPNITTTMTEDSCPLKEKSQASRGRREGSAHLPASPTSRNIGGKKLQAVNLSSALLLNRNLVNKSKSQGETDGGGLRSVRTMQELWERHHRQRHQRTEEDLEKRWQMRKGDHEDLAAVPLERRMQNGI